VKRVAAAVGEGAQVVATLHGVLTAAARPLGAVSGSRGRRLDGLLLKTEPWT
jgi:hypothetical protein